MPGGAVVTFYSYKGGVGRSFMLANVGAVLAEWGYHVVCVDWDLEAPGLSHYFRPWLDQHEPYGLVEFIKEISTSERVPNSRRLRAPVNLPRIKGQLHLVRAGIQDDSYTRRMQEIDWAGLYERHNLGLTIESLRAEWINQYDFVLVDSRTGITDIGGICTVQLPDILVFMFTANEQSLDGAIDVVQRSIKARQLLPYDRGQLLALPVPSRFESRVEYARATQWKERFAKSLDSFYTNWATRETTAGQILERTTVPNFPYWSFGEELPVIEQSNRDLDSVGYHCETVAALIAHRLIKSDLLIESRDSYVDAAMRAGLRRGRYDYDVFISYAKGSASEEAASQLASMLSQNLRVFRDVDTLVPGSEFSAEIESALNRSRYMIALISSSPSRWQEREINSFMKQTLDDASDRTVFPILVGGASPEDLPSLLRSRIAFTVADEQSLASIAHEVIERTHSVEK